jgi:predicted transcriptional regulator
MTIPHYLKIKVLREYLEGIKREQIAKNNGISTGAVSMIVDEFRKDIPDIDKLREMAVQIKASGYDLNDYFRAIRHINHVKKLGLTEEKSEKIIEEFHEYAFKNNMDVPTLFDSVLRGLKMAKEWGIDLEYLERHISGRVLVNDAMESNIRRLQNDIEVLPHKFNIKLADLLEYQITKPIVDKKINSMNEDLKIKDMRIKLLEDERDELKSQLQEKVNTSNMSNNMLVDQNEKKDKVDGLEYNESDYMDNFFIRASKKNISYLYRNNNEEPDSNL